MIISASRRTDIPAFYADWMMNRIRAGYCAVPNPFNRKQISRISLLPSDVEVIVFWTRKVRKTSRTLPVAIDVRRIWFPSLSQSDDSLAKRRDTRKVRQRSVRIRSTIIAAQRVTPQGGANNNV